MWGANTFPSRNRLPYPISRSQDRDFSLLRFSRCLPFPTCGIKDVRWRLHCFDDFQPVVSAGDFTGDRSTKCWSIPESLLALVFFSLGVYFYAFSLLICTCLSEHKFALHFIAFHICYLLCWILVFHVGWGCYY